MSESPASDASPSASTSMNADQQQRSPAAYVLLLRARASKAPWKGEDLKKWEDEEMLESLREMFITGAVGQDGGEEGEGYEDATEAGGDFEDLEAEGRSKTDFYTEKKDEISRQLQVNLAEFQDVPAESRALVEGFRPGTYMHIELADVPCEMIEHSDPAYPIVVGGLLPAEERFGYVQVRIKWHRWYVKTLKTNDPLIFSLGWRRFQSVPIYSLDDHSIRMRMGSSTRWSVGGGGLDIDRSVKIVKIKLTGVPYKIFKNTAFVKDIFSTALEVAKFEGVNIRTVSGIRGQVKKGLSKPDGAFRATFEDKLLNRYNIPAGVVFDPAAQALQPGDVAVAVAQGAVDGMRLTGQVRRDEGLKTPLQVSSTYKRIERPARRFNPLVIPRKLQAVLPYASKVHVMAPQRQATYMQKRAVVMEPEERKAVALLQQIRALRKDQVAKEEERKGEKVKERKKEVMRATGRKSKREAEAEEGRGSKRRGESDSRGFLLQEIVVEVTALSMVQWTNIRSL
ncbi:hypothetical protein C8J57DRAFT_1556286 [Mycena rebaudengoi]|nr:hypothetical protein C8J57DRAFT_1556286 [Mycena rebaudengoi]